jgi:hypothetical protein
METYQTYLEALRSRLQGVKWETYGKAEAGPLICFSTPGKGNRFYITSGIYSDEPASMMTFVRHGQVVVDMAKASGVGLRVYPCINPSAWGKPQRPKARQPTVIFEGEGDDLRVAKELSQEGRALAADLALKPPPRAVLDLRQDPTESPVSYALVSGSLAPYRTISRAAARFATIGTGLTVGSAQTDRSGLAQAPQDGSVRDYFVRLGTPYAATLVSSQTLPTKSVMGVNLVWLMGFIELSSR